MRAFLLVDDHTVLRNGVARLLKVSFPDAKIGEAGNGEEALRLLAASPWDVMLLDIRLPDRSGLEILQEVQQRWPALPVLVLTGLTDDAVALRVFEIGAMGYLAKDCSEDDLLKAVQKLLTGGRYLTPSLAEKLAKNLSNPRKPMPPDDAPPLKGRMLDVLIRIGKGDAVKSIAADMQVSIKTVSTYRTRLLERLHLKSNTDIVRYCLIRGLTQ